MAFSSAPRAPLPLHRERPQLPSAGALAILAGALVSCADSEVAADDLSGERFDFVDVAAQAGIDLVNVCGDPRRWYIPESNGCGAAWLDYDGDGDLDLFVANGSRMAYHEDGARLEILHDGQSRLYRNEGQLSFRDVTSDTGTGRREWINAVATADADGDGDTDLYLACLGDDVFLRNENGVFRDATAEAGLGNADWGAGATFGDVDGDGDLDLYVANYCEFDPENPPAGGERAVYDGVEVAFGPEGEAGPGINPGAPDRFFLNRGQGRFEESTEDSGFALRKDLCSYACVFSDVTGDGWVDLLVANDLQPANLFVNDGQGHFEDQALARGFALNGAGEPTSAMGLCVADVDGDLDLDVLRTNFDLEPNSLHLNNGRGYFSEAAAEHGLGEASFDRLGWGGGFFDADLDGDLDLLVANGHVFPQAEEIGMHPWAQISQLFAARVEDGEVRWRDATATSGEGLAAPRSARGVAFGDPDDDGDLDALIVDMDAPPRLLENRTPRRGRWIGLRLMGNAGNRDGYGAWVIAQAGERRWLREVRTTDGLYSAHDPRVFFGLGDITALDRIEVRWPGGQIDVLDAPALDQFHTLRKSASESR